MGNRFRVSADLLLVDALTLLLIAIIVLFSSSALRVVIGLPVVLFFPGYALVAALFPERGQPGWTGRLTYSFAVGVALTALIGLVLNYTPLGVSLYPVLVSLTVFIVVCSAVACYRRLKLPCEQRFELTFHHVAVPRWSGLARGDRASWVALAVSLLAVAGAVAYLIAVPTPRAASTEFYVVGPVGEVGQYPGLVAEGDEASVTLGIVNHEGAAVSYVVEVYVSDVEETGIGPLVLADEGEWEGDVSFTLWQAGDGQRVDFLLYKDGESEPFTDLHILIDVVQ